MEKKTPNLLLKLHLIIYPNGPTFFIYCLICKYLFFTLDEISIQDLSIHPNKDFNGLYYFICMNTNSIMYYNLGSVILTARLLFLRFRILENNLLKTKILKNFKSCPFAALFYLVDYMGRGFLEKESSVLNKSLERH